MRVAYKNYWFFVIVFSFNFELQSSSANIFPFIKNPELSWSDFEQNFRKTYAHLDIPPLVVTDYFKTTAMYIAAQDDPDFPQELLDDAKYEAMITQYEKQGKDEKFLKSLKSLKGVVPPFIAIDLSQNNCMSWQEMAYILLHEMGHYECDKNGLHQKNHNQVKKVADVFSYGALTAVTLYNAYLASQKRWSGRAMVAQSIIMLLYSSSSIHSLFKDIFAVRPEEFIADDFANKHATQEILLAGRHWCTIEHTLELLCLNNPNITPIIQNPQTNMDKFIVKALRFFASLSWIDYSHPSDTVRIKRIDQALQNRFAVKN